MYRQNSQGDWSDCHLPEFDYDDSIRDWIISCDFIPNEYLNCWLHRLYTCSKMVFLLVNNEFHRFVFSAQFIICTVLEVMVNTPNVPTSIYVYLHGVSVLWRKNLKVS